MLKFSSWHYLSLNRFLFAKFSLYSFYICAILINRHYLYLLILIFCSNNQIFFKRIRFFPFHLPFLLIFLKWDFQKNFISECLKVCLKKHSNLDNINYYFYIACIFYQRKEIRYL